MKLNCLLPYLLVISSILSCAASENNLERKHKKGMFKITILYPGGDGKTFDIDYYAEKHMPMVASELGEAIEFYEIDRGISGRTPDDETPYLAIGYLYVEKLAAYQEAFQAKAAKITGDIPNYTNIQPIVQISEVY